MTDVSLAEVVAPLDDCSDRLDIHTRLVGPLATSALVYGVDEIRRREAEKPSGFLEAAQEEFDRLDPRLYVSIRHLAALFEKGVSERGQFPTPAQVGAERIGSGYISAGQNVFLAEFTALQQAQALVEEGYGAQANITFNMALPGYLIAKYALSPTSEEVVGALGDEGLSGIAEILRSRDFIMSLSRLALTGNGLFREAMHQYIDKQEYDMDRADPVFDATHEMNSLRREAFTARYGAFPESVFIVDLYEKKPDGTIVLTERTREMLRAYMNLRNEVVPSADRMGGAPGPSRGCPVVQASVRVNRADYTEPQWADLTGGDNPVTTYDEKSQRLTIVRQAIPEVSRFFADVLSGEVS